jgi:hypothetical protein
MDVAVDSQALPRMQARLTLTVNLAVGTFVAGLLAIAICIVLASGQMARLGFDLTQLPLPLHSLKSVTPEWKDWDDHFKVDEGLPLSW